MRQASTLQARALEPRARQAHARQARTRQAHARQASTRQARAHQASPLTLDRQNHRRLLRSIRLTR